MMDKKLHRKSWDGPLLKRCLTEEEVQEVMRQIHERVCGNHTGGRNLAHKATSQGYFWPKMLRDADKLVRKCDKCQRFSHKTHVPANKLHCVVSAWPFKHWGIDIVGALPLAPRRRKYAIVTTDYFTKWVEVEAHANITQTEVIKFIWKNIVCRFGIPQKIIADNGTQFTGKTVKKLCSEREIQLISLPEYTHKGMDKPNPPTKSSSNA